MPSYVRGRTARALPDSEIIRLYLSGMDGESVGYRAGCSGTTVLNLVRQAGHPIRPSGGKRSSLKASIEEIARRYKEGQSGPQIAQSIGCTTSAVYHALRRAGVEIRPDAVAARMQRARSKPKDKPVG